ncbi:MAG: methyl-accepting chemotaxis protein [Treponema sp.]|jgi:methyl-accepting chemotaxis protein|nr:methyl-accepting chemotaxis protein [Treponema sp.]
MKFYYSLRFQFIALFSVFVIVLCGTMSFLAISKMSSAVTKTFSEQGVFIVKKALSAIDGDSFEALVKSMDKNDPYYEETRVKLLEIKESYHCMYLYTMAPVTDSIWHFIIDGSAETWDEENFSALGLEEDVSEYDNAFKKVLTSGKIEFSGLMNQVGWGWVISVYAGIRNSAGEMVGIAACDFDGTFLHETILSNGIRQAVVAGVFLLIGIMLAMFFIRRIFLPLNRINVILKEVSEGEGDLTRTISVNTKNEMGSLAHYFNLTLEKIKKLVMLIKQEASSLSEIGNDLASNMKETASAVHEITENIQKIKNRVFNQSASVSETNATMEHVVANIKKLNGNIGNQNMHISQVSTAIEEMVASINSVTVTLIKNENNVQTLMGASGIGSAGLHEVAQNIQEIARESEGLSEINSVMENISSQTNLLSMNAAIEAAHAGEAGKGFAVVADEIRKLAEGSNQQSKTIGAVLKKIKNSIDKITLSTENVLNKFEAIDLSVKTVAEQEEIIRRAMEEQGAGSKQVLEGVGGVNEITRDVTGSSGEMLEGANEVIQESSNLESLTQEITTGMNEMASGASQINLAISHVSDISNRNREAINLLMKEVARFKVE